MQTTIVYWVIKGVKEKKMKTTIVYWSYIMDNGKESKNYYDILEFYRDNVCFCLSTSQVPRQGTDMHWPPFARLAD